MNVRHVLVGTVGAVALAFWVRGSVWPTLQLRVSKFAFPGGAPALQGKLPGSPFVWCEIGEDNRVHFYPPRAELGQGSHTLLAQLLAEELEVDPGVVVIHPPDTSRGFDARSMTVAGSASVYNLQQPLREAAAAVREMLRAEAAPRLGCAAEEVVARDGRLHADGDASRSLTYGEVVAMKKGQWQVPKRAPALKAPEQFRVVGRSVPRVDLREKLTGRADFAYDVHLPEMLYGAVARPPRHGAKLQEARTADAARRRPGVVAVVVEEGFAGVVAERRSQAHDALGYLELEWSGGEAADQADIEAAVDLPAHGGVVVQREGDAGMYLDGDEHPSVHTYHAEYRTQMVAALPAEPPVAVANVWPGGVTIHSSTQTPRLIRASVAKTLGCREGEVRVVTPYVGGSFGRKHGWLGDPAAEAARLSAAVGRPVQVGWTTGDDLSHGPKRPPSRSVLRAALDEDGKIRALEHRSATGDASMGWPELRKVARTTGLDLLSVFGAHVIYGAIPNRSVRVHRVPVSGVLNGGFRAVGLPANLFALEGFVDELAHHAGEDPVAYRLRHLDEDDELLGRGLRRVLKAASECAGWGTPAPRGRARGVACYVYAQTPVAQVAEVGLEEGRLRVHKVTCAVDAGRIVNPDVAASQVEGATNMGLSWALCEEALVEGGAVVNANLDSYQILTMRDAPEVEAVLLESDRWASGLNEAPAGPVGAAVANALFALTGRRARALPLRLDRQSAMADRGDVE